MYQTVEILSPGSNHRVQAMLPMRTEGSNSTEPTTARLVSTSKPRWTADPPFVVDKPAIMQDYDNEDVTMPPEELLVLGKPRYNIDEILRVSEDGGPRDLANVPDFFPTSPSNPTDGSVEAMSKHFEGSLYVLEATNIAFSRLRRYRIALHDIVNQLNEIIPTLRRGVLEPVRHYLAQIVSHRHDVIGFPARTRDIRTLEQLTDRLWQRRAFYKNEADGYAQVQAFAYYEIWDLFEPHYGVLCRLRKDAAYELGEEVDMNYGGVETKTKRQETSAYVHERLNNCMGICSRLRDELRQFRNGLVHAMQEFRTGNQPNADADLQATVKRAREVVRGLTDTRQFQNTEYSHVSSELRKAICLHKVVVYGDEDGKRIVQMICNLDNEVEGITGFYEDAPAVSQGSGSLSASLDPRSCHFVDRNKGYRYDEDGNIEK